MVAAESNAQNDQEPEGFGSALVDEAARRDAALGDADWASVPEGAVRGTFGAPSGTLATLSMGTPGNPRVLLIPGATGEFDATYGITSDGELRTAKLTGVLYSGKPAMTYSMTVDDYGTSKDITAP